MAAPSVTEFFNVADFQKFVTSTGRLIVVYFYAPWAAQCKQMMEVLTELTKDKQLLNVAFAKIEAEEVPDLSEKYDIAAVPTFVFLKDNKEVDRLDGADVSELTKKVRQLSLIHGGVDAPPQQEDLNERLKRLINSAGVIVFIKGTPQQPQCGFSRQIVTILNEHGIKFSTFNILADNEVRQGLKTYSDWPTYPQVYVKGELIGGLDIIKELAETNELASQLMVTNELSLDDRLKSLVNSASVMLFMKGCPEEPRCGFSRTTTAILNETGVPYKTFDILQDNQVREGLKKLYDWPTYPQLYVNGDLIGGVDIIKELKASGELVTTLKGE